jgi:hypothetical protein
MAVGVEAFTAVAAAEAPVEAVSAAGLAMQAEDIEAAPMEARVLSVAEPRTAAEVSVAARPREVSERTGDRMAASADRVG